jgi:hypothetical protein
MNSFRHALMFSALSLALPSGVGAVPVFSVGGDDTMASIQMTVDQFRAALGANNGVVQAPFPDGRREINWDGGGSLDTAVSSTPFAGFQLTRGALFEGPPGTQFIQAPLDGFVTTFNNPTYDDTFSFFSPVRIFAPIGSTTSDAVFFVPGTTDVRATTDGFGAIFTDVDSMNLTRIDYLDINNALLESHFVEPGTVANGSFSFLGVVFDSSVVGRVRITTGNAILGPNDGGGIDVVAMDDFIFGEPQKVPEPGTLLLMGAGLAGIAAWGRKRGKATETQ